MEDITINERIKHMVMLFTLLICLFIVMASSFKLGMVYMCEKDGLKLAIEPEYKCVNEEEIQERLKQNEEYNPGWWLNSSTGTEAIRTI